MRNEPVPEKARWATLGVVDELVDGAVLTEEHLGGVDAAPGGGARTGPTPAARGRFERRNPGQQCIRYFQRVRYLYVVTTYD